MHKYLITSKEFYTDNPSVFTQTLSKQLQIHKPDYVLFRDKTNPNYKFQAPHFLKVCQEFHVKSFIHQDIELARELNVTGVHLSSTQANKIGDAKNMGLEVIISTHTYGEVLDAQALGADAVTYSPIFFSPNKGTPKGVEDLKALLKKCDIKVFALGGIVEASQVKIIEETGAYGFSSIRYFYATSDYSPKFN